VLSAALASLSAELTLSAALTSLSAALLSALRCSKRCADCSQRCAALSAVLTSLSAVLATHSVALRWLLLALCCCRSLRRATAFWAVLLLFVLLREFYMRSVNGRMAEKFDDEGHVRGRTIDEELARSCMGYSFEQR
jgi:hypothetical protein